MHRHLGQAFLLVLTVGSFASTAHAQTTPYTQWITTWDQTWKTYQAINAAPPAQNGLVVQSQDLPIVINAPIDDVYAVYANVYNAIGMHPFLKQIIPIHYNFVAGVPTFDFIALEDVPLPDGTIFHGVTVAQQRFHNREHYYDADSFDQPGVITHQHIEFIRIDRDHTKVVEHLTFEAPPELLALEVQGGVAAHAAVQAGVKAAMEAGTLKATHFDAVIEGDFQAAFGNQQ
jgi:hypothetical protein